MQSSERNSVSIDDAAFARLYRQRIAPILAARDIERPSTARKSRNIFWAQLLGSFSVGAAAFAFSESASLAIVAGGFALLILQAVLAEPLVAMARDVRSDTYAVLAEAVGCTFERDGFEPDTYHQLFDLGFLLGRKKRTFRDRFAGRCKGRAFSFFWARLIDDYGDDSRVSFEGQLICIEFPEERFRNVVVRSDRRIVTSLADLVRSVFGAIAEAEPPRPAEPALVKRVSELEQGFKERNLRVGFKQGRLLIVAESAEPENSMGWWRHLRRLLAYERHYQAGISVGTRKANQIEDSLNEESPATAQTMDAPLNTLARARAITAEVRETLRLIDSVLETAP